jgi:hypothetical protein
MVVVALSAIQLGLSGELVVESSTRRDGSPKHSPFQDDSQSGLSKNPDSVHALAAALSEPHLGLRATLRTGLEGILTHHLL